MAFGLLRSTVQRAFWGASRPGSNWFVPWTWCTTPQLSHTVPHLVTPSCHHGNRMSGGMVRGEWRRSPPRAETAAKVPFDQTSRHKMLKMLKLPRCVISSLIPGDSSVQVRMWNTCVLHLQSHLVLTISASHHDRIVKELLICAAHRCHVAPCCCSGSPVHRRCDTTDRFIQPDASSSSSSALCGDETRLTRPPAEDLLSKGRRPPWRYWRRTGAEPQHRQPGEEEP